MPTAPPAPPDTLHCGNLRAARVDCIVATRWLGRSSPEEFVELLAFIQKASETAGGKVDLFAIATTFEATPPAPLRDAMNAFATETRELIEATDIVLLGKSGFWQTIVRSIITSLITFSRGHRRTAVHATVDDALAAICERRGMNRDAFRATLADYAIVTSADSSGSFAA